MSDSIHVRTWRGPLAEFVIGAYQGQLCLLDYRYRRLRQRVDQRVQRNLGASFLEADDPVSDATIAQLEEYGRGERQQFELPLRLAGSEFQQAVWQALMAVPYGGTASYGELAERLGQPQAVRAVANANGANALALVVPCHRIIGRRGELVGYGGGLELKRRLLRLEQEHVGQLPLFADHPSAETNDE